MRRRLLLAPVVLAAGCSTAAHVPCLIEQHVAAVAATRVESSIVPCAATDMPTTPADLPGLWQLALTHEPTLREAGAEIEIARGRLIQATKYPNPRIAYRAELLGSSISGKGNEVVEVTQEIVTCHKRPLEIAAAGRGLDGAIVALTARKFDALTRLRRAYYEYQALRYANEINQQVVKSLEQAEAITRKLVEEAKIWSRRDLLRAQALLEQARANSAKQQASINGAWKEVAAVVGVPNLPPPSAPMPLPTLVPTWSDESVRERVLSSHTELAQAALETERARLEYERARAESVPNFAVGAGYGRAYVEETGGLALSLETAIPLWDRKQGLIHEKRARWSQAEAAQRSAATRLNRETADAYARYEGARVQAERLTTVVLPKLEESLKLLREAFDAGGMGLSFADIQLAIDALNDARIKLADTRRDLWRAVADLEGLMQLDLDEPMPTPK
jgi:cobalt-zinc-cadmium efflux system outer membrane protein